MGQTLYAGIPWPEPSDPTTTWEYWEGYATRVEKYRAPIARVADTVNQQSIPASERTPLEFADVQYERPPGMWNPDDHTFTIPEDGIWEVSVFAELLLGETDPSSYSSFIYIQVLKPNGFNDDIAKTTFKSGLDATRPVTGPTGSTARVAPLKNGDVLRSGVYLQADDAFPRALNRAFTVRKTAPLPDNVPDNYLSILARTT